MHDVLYVPEVKVNLFSVRSATTKNVIIQFGHSKCWLKDKHDDYTRYAYVYFIREKAEVLEKFKQFEALVTNQLGMAIGAVRSDGGGEYVGRDFKNYFLSKGIHHQLTVRYTPEQNGVTERFNRTICESARAMIAAAAEESKNQSITPTVDLSSPVGTDKAKTDEIVKPRYSTHPHNPPVRYGIDEYMCTSTHHVAMHACGLVEPRSYSEAIASPHSKDWLAAAKCEYQSLIDNDTWELVELPERRRAIDSKWVFMAKHD
ncbi:uncharacterized protein [Watersipora subatra]|uniref:uncharacterized protein n=1 Tax=Watersipora subatra TaxID=2589382 RepID=UPI00355BEC1C